MGDRRRAACCHADFLPHAKIIEFCPKNLNVRLADWVCRLFLFKFHQILDDQFTRSENYISISQIIEAAKNMASSAINAFNPFGDHIFPLIPQRNDNRLLCFCDDIFRYFLIQKPRLVCCIIFYVLRSF